MKTIRTCVYPPLAKVRDSAGGVYFQGLGNTTRTREGKLGAMTDLGYPRVSPQLLRI